MGWLGSLLGTAGGFLLNPMAAIPGGTAGALVDDKSLTDPGSKAGVSSGIDPAKAQAAAANGALQNYVNSGTAGQNSLLADIINTYSQGRISLQDAINQANSQGGSGAVNALMTSPAAASRVAQDQVMQDPTLAGIFNSGGQMSQAQGQYSSASNNLASDRNALMGRDQSYGLTDQDLAAYGQAAGNITRQFGSQQSSLSQALANQGLTAAPSGSALQGFSTVFGNQSEQLAGLQSQIAQNRIQTAQQLAQARTSADLSQQANAQSYVGSLGALGQNAQTNAFNRNLQGSQNAYNQLAGAAGQSLQNQNLQQSIDNSQFMQQQETQKPGLFEQLGNAVVSAPGQLISSATGAAGKSLGSYIGGGAGGIGSGTAGGTAALGK